MRVLGVLLVLLATTVQAQVSRDGVVLPPGSNTLKSLHMRNYPGLGIYAPAAGVMFIGDESSGITCTYGSGCDLTGSFPLLAPNGGSGAPSYSFASAPTSGIWYGGGIGVRAADGSGTDDDGTHAVIYGGAGTGTGDGGDVRLYVAPPSPTSGTTPNPHQAAIWIYGGSGSITMGALNVPTSPGVVRLAGTDIQSGQTDEAGGLLDLRGGLGTGAGVPGVIRLKTGTTLGSGTTEQAATTRMTISEAGVLLADILFANLGTPTDGTIAYCSDCTKATPCAGSGNGALAKRLNGAWDCD